MKKLRSEQNRPQNGTHPYHCLYCNWFQLIPENPEEVHDRFAFLYDFRQYKLFMTKRNNHKFQFSIQNKYKSFTRETKHVNTSPHYCTPVHIMCGWSYYPCQRFMHPVGLDGGYKYNNILLSNRKTQRCPENVNLNN